MNLHLSLKGNIAMSAAVTSRKCALCAHSLAGDRVGCPHCEASIGWLELARAATFTVQRFEQLYLEGELEGARLKSLIGYYHRQKALMIELIGLGNSPPTRTKEGSGATLELALPSPTSCYSCRARLDPLLAFCPECGAAGNVPEVRSLLVLTFFAREVRRQQMAGRLSLAQAQELAAETSLRYTVLSQKLDKLRRLVLDAPASPVAAPHRSLVFIPKRKEEILSGCAGELV